MLLRHAWHSFRATWPAYAGAFVALTGGVALIGLTVATVAAVDVTGRRPGITQAERAQLDDLASLFGIMAGVSLFMAVFVVASTFGFVVATRRRELGLLRLIGATPRQTRRLLLAEAGVVAALAGATGCLLATALSPAAFAAVRRLGLTTLTLEPPGPGLVWAIAAPSGAAVALVGAWRASKRGARTSPAASMQEAVSERRRPGLGQLLTAVVCLAGVVATVALAGDLPPVFALVLGILLPEAVVVGLVCVGGLVFPWLAALLARPFAERDVAARLARDHLRASVRLPAALAAPVLAISAIAGSMILALSFTADWTAALDREQLRAPLVVRTSATLDGVDGVDEVDGVAVADVRRQVAAHVVDGREELEVVDVAAARAARGLRAVRGDLADLRGTALAVTESWALDSSAGLGSTLAVKLAGERLRLRVVAVVPDAPDLYGDLLVPADLAPSADSVGTVFVVPAPGADPSAALAAHGEVLTADAWIHEVTEETRDAHDLGLWVLLGPAAAYAAIGIVNAVLIGAAQRAPQLRAARLLGATPAQVRRMALWEAGLVGAAALLVGGAVVGFVGWLVRQAIARDVPGAAKTIPWGPLTAVAVACAALVLAAAAVGSRAAARVR